MTSLFSSFDTMIFFYSYSFLVFFPFFYLKLCYMISFDNKFFNKLFSFMLNFLGSLNNFNFAKGLSMFIIFLMLSIFFMNLSSIFPFNFAMTSQASSVLMLALILWIPFVSFSFFKNFKTHMGHLIPEGSPLGLSPILFLIELVSTLIRPITLMVRLVANILAGHLLIILLSSFVSQFNYSFVLLSMLNMVEMLVALIQSYIFITLVSLYYSEM